MSDVVLIADGGQMTVGRRTATHVYGSMRVTAPEGVEVVEDDERLQLGYIYRPDDQPTGRFDLAFVRADVTQDMETHISNFEEALDTAEVRVAGEVFFEREISAAGLGRYRPGVDLATGDVVDVRIWGRLLELPVTATTMVVSDSERAGWSVHVGGQFISDAETLRRQNAQVQAAIDADRRRAAKAAIDASTRQAALAAQSAAANAQSAADNAASSLALVEAQQQQTAAEQDARLEAQEQMIETLREVQLATISATTVTLVASGTSSRGDGTVTIASGRDATVTAHGSWVGKMIVHAEWYSSSMTSVEGGQVTDSRYPSLMQEFPIPNAASRTVSLGSVSSDRRWVRVDYQIHPGTQQARNLAGGSFAVAQDQWVTVPGQDWTVPSGAAQLSIYCKAGWDAAPFLPAYGVRILVNGTVVKTWGPNANLGPLFGNGYRHTTVSLNQNIAAGATVTFQVFTSAALAHERVVRDTETRISWIKQD